MPMPSFCTMRAGALTVTGAMTAAMLLFPAGRAAADEFVVAAAQTELRFWPSAEEFARHMSRRIKEAMQHSPDLIVFPEDIGLPLVALGDADLVEQAGSLDEAMAMVLTRHAAEIGEIVAEHGVSPQRALWILRAPTIRAAYEDTFSTLAREHGVYIAAGSVPMMLPGRPSDVFNTACVFDPEGEMHVVGTKMHLVEPLETQEGLDLSTGSADDYKVFTMPGATLGVIICADAWDSGIAAALVEQGADVLVQISANPETWSEDTKVAWQDSIFSRVQDLGVYGVCVMGVGHLLGMPFEGCSSVVAPRAWTTDRSGVLAEADSATEERMLVTTLHLPGGAD